MLHMLEKLLHATPHKEGAFRLTAVDKGGFGVRRDYRHGVQSSWNRFQTGTILERTPTGLNRPAGINGRCGAAYGVMVAEKHVAFVHGPDFISTHIAGDLAKLQ
jgi:hypothetical protein